MSQASDLIAEVKQALGEVTKELKAYEGDFEELGSFTDLGHLNVANIHLSELLGELRNRRGNREDAELAAMEAEETTVQPPSDESASPAAQPDPATPPASELAPPAPAESAPDAPNPVGDLVAPSAPKEASTA